MTRQEMIDYVQPNCDFDCSELSDSQLEFLVEHERTHEILQKILDL